MNFTETIRPAVQWDFAAQFEGFLKIERKGGEIVRPVANTHQLRLDAVMKAARRMNRPCRIIALKPRQKGSSTASVGIGHMRLKAKRGRGLIAGGAHFQGANLFRILKTYADHDELDPKSCKVMDTEARYKNGSTMERITLANPNAGRSGTYQVLVVTEAAYLANEGVANADVVTDGLLKCVPMEPDTLIIVESTANGASGYFYDVWQGGITLEEFEAGKAGFVKVFSAWFEFDDSRMDPALMGIASPDDYTAQEVEYVAALWRDQGVQLDMEQVAWMRYAVKEECRGDWDKFDQDYPRSAETAFLKSGRCLFDESGLAYQTKVASEREMKTGILQHNEHTGGIAFVQTGDGQARMMRWEEPRVGCRYLVAVDSASGEDQTGGDDPDSHAAFVIRAGYLDHRGCWIESAVVMANMLVPGHKAGSMVCWWANDILTDEVWKMARYYQAIVVPEENHDRGLIEILRQRGDVAIYRRPIFNRRENTETNALGWQTTVKTRPMMLETLAAAVREAGRGGVGLGLEVRCPWALKEMRNFGTKPNGRMEALVGHDDRVLGLAIGIQCVGHATPYRERIVERWIPPDLRKYEMRTRVGRVRGGMS